MGLKTAGETPEPGISCLVGTNPWASEGFAGVFYMDLGEIYIRMAPFDVKTPGSYIERSPREHSARLVYI
jgi:hypothetical protein